MFAHRSWLGALSAFTMLLQATCGQAQIAGQPAEEPAAAQGQVNPEVETLKERLSDKASDQQRVDNCKVPPDRRGSKARPDACGSDAAGVASPPPAQ
jgi:hypothetical protein